MKDNRLFNANVGYCKKIVSLILLISVVGLIIWITLLSRTPKDRQVYLIPFASYVKAAEGKMVWLVENIENIIMFLPIGFFAQSITQRIKRTVMGGFGFSLCIELMQFVTQRGCLEIDDLIHNTLGTYLGAILYLIITLLLFERKKMED